eukprot:scaffold93386_cov26-Prasinocladus_malaysianus.AAC.1
MMRNEQNKFSLYGPRQFFCALLSYRSLFNVKLQLAGVTNSGDLSRSGQTIWAEIRHVVPGLRAV